MIRETTAGPALDANVAVRSPFYDLLATWLVLALCLGATWAAWHAAIQAQTEYENSSFHRYAEDIESTLQHQFNLFDGVLHGSASLFAATERVTHRQWNAYADGLKLNRYDSAVRSMGYGERVTASTKNTHIQNMRKDGLPEYRIWPEGDRQEYVPARFIKYYIDTRGPSAHGFDMLSEHSRRAAIFKARDSGDTAITDSLAPAIASAHHNTAVLMYHPVYRGNESPDSLAAKRAAIAGYVFLGLDLEQFFDSVIKRSHFGIRLKVRENAGAQTKTIYDSAPSAASQGSSLTRTAQLEIGDKVWALELAATPQFRATVDYDRPRIVLLAGLLISALLFALTWIMANARKNALTTAHRMTAALRDQEEFNRSIVDTAVDAIIVIDEQGAIQSYNRAAEHIFGYTPDEVLHNNVRMLMPSPDRERHDSYIARYVTTGEKRIIGVGREVTGLRKNGERFPMDLAISEVLLRGKRAFTGIVRDISERKRAENQILKLNHDLLLRAQELAESNQELKAFSYTVSHDLRAPLRHITGHIGMAAERPIDADTRNLLSIIAASAERMGILIDNLLAFSRIGHMEIRRQPVNLTPLTRQIISDMSPDTRHRKILWKVGEMPAVHADPVLLKIVLTNLLSNAVKFTGLRDAALIEIGARDESGAAHITIFVRDNGAGFDMYYASKLFTVFQRQHRQEEFEGTGVGLATVHRIILRHGGKVWAESAPDKGTTIFFSLPTNADQHVNP